MLKHFACGPNKEIVLGDLAEQYRRNSSAAWYWRQSMKAIPIGLFSEIRGHKGNAAQTLLIGWGIWAFYVLWVVPFLTPYFLGGNFGVSIVPSEPIGSAWSALWAPVLMQFNGPKPFSMVFAFVLPFVVWSMCGWLAARLQREQQRVVVLVLALSVLVVNVLLAGPFMFRVGWRLGFAVLGSLAANAVASVIGVLVGGKLFSNDLGTNPLMRQ